MTEDPKKPLRLLLVEDSEDDADLLIDELKRGGYDVGAFRVETAEALTAALRESDWDIVISDHSLPTFSASAAIGLVRDTGLDLPFIMVSGTVGEEVAAEAIRMGINDFLLKGNLRRLVRAVERELREAATRAEHRKVQQQLLVSERMAEARLMRTVKELNRSNNELQQFAYIASHDLQEPLRMVASYTQLLAKRYKGRLDADADEFIAFAVDGANRMQHLIQGLLAYSRVRTNGQDLLHTSSEEALEEALLNLADVIQESGALITHDALPTVLADETQLVQLFQNLVSNAIKYQGPGVPRIHISATRNGDKPADSIWLFSVQDSGLGIEPRYFERIFGMFQRLHRRDEFGGTGIGLAICKTIVERHGGSIYVESRPGQGSTFRFMLAGGNAAPPC